MEGQVKMGRREKCAKLSDLPTCKVDFIESLGPWKGAFESKAFALLDSSPVNKMIANNEEWKHASVAADISSYTARSEELRKRVQEMLSKSSKKPKSLHDRPLINPPALLVASDLAFTRSNEQKNSCKRNLFLSDFSSPSIREGMPSSLGSLQMSGSDFIMMKKSKVELKECPKRLIQEGVDISGDSSIVKNDIKSLDLRDERKLVIEIPDDDDDGTCCLSQSEGKFQCVQEKGLEDCSQNTGSKFDKPADCQINAHCQQDIMGHGLKNKQDGEPTKMIDGIEEKQELKSQNTGAENVMEHVNKKLNFSHDSQLSQQHVDIGAKTDGKGRFNISVHTVTGLQNSTKGIRHRDLQNIEKLPEEKTKEPDKITVEKAMEVDVVDYAEIEYPWEREMQNESDEEDNDEISLMWKQMSLSFKCSQSTVNQHMDSTYDKDDTEDCLHSFILEDDLGKVCTLCGFIGQSIETIFDIQWPKARKGTKYSRHVPNRDLETVLGIDNQTFDSKRSEQTSSVLKIVVHPHLRKHMKSHQMDGFDFLQKNLITEEPGGCILAHAPGTGKTFLVISFIQSFLTKYPDERPLIVAPKSILCSWMTEFKKWQVEEIPVHNIYEVTNKLETLRCKQLQTLKEWKEKKSILLVSYSQFSSIVCENAENEMTASCQKILLEGPGLLVLDEGHFPRNQNTNILNALTQIHTRRRILLSGTLYQNNIKELFNLLRLVRPEILELESFQAIFRRLITSISGSEMHQKLFYKRHAQDPLERIFCDVLEYALQSFNDEVKMSALHDLQELTALFVHYYKGDILEDLPGLFDFTVKLDLNEKQRKALGKLHIIGNRMTRDVMSGAICIHPSLRKYGENISGWLESDGKNNGSMFASIQADPNDGVKTKFVLDMLSLCESTKEKVIVFSQYLPPLSLLENMIMAEKNWTKSREILRLDGSTATEVRGSIIEQFNNSPDSKVLFASIKACGEGICLTAASRVIILDIPWNPSISRQAISRAYRIGQKKKVYAYRLVAANTQEEDIHQASLKKELMSKMLFEGNNKSEDSISLLDEVNQDDCEDLFFQSGSPLRQNLLALYKQTFV